MSSAQDHLPRRVPTCERLIRPGTGEVAMRCHLSIALDDGDFGRWDNSSTSAPNFPESGPIRERCWHHAAATPWSVPRLPFSYTRRPNSENRYEKRVLVSIRRSFAQSRRACDRR